MKFWNRHRGELLLFLLMVAITLAFISHLVDRNELYSCNIKGVNIILTKGELDRSSILVFGSLRDGREVALNRYSMEGCFRWTPQTTK